MESQTTAPAPGVGRRCLRIALLLALTLPLLRVAEAVARRILLPSFYDSFWDALTAEMWFTQLWWLYTSTSVGWWTLYAMALWAAAAPVRAVLPSVRRRKTFLAGVAAVCLIGLAVATFRLEFHWGGRSQREWVWCLRSHDPELRREAASGLSFHIFKFGVPDGTATLARRGLRDEVLEVRQFAAAFFARYPTADVVPDLAESLADTDASVRSDAASALAQLGRGAADALPQLKASLDDPVPGVRANAAGAYLAAGGDPALGLSVLERLVTAPDADDRRRAGHVLAAVAAKYPDRAFPLLATLLQDWDKDVRFYTTLAVYGLGPNAKPLTPALLLNLSDGAHFVRGIAASVLGKIGPADDQVVAAVIPLLKDPEWSVRWDAADALGGMGAVSARTALQQALDDPEPRVRTSARDAIERLERSGVNGGTRE